MKFILYTLISFIVSLCHSELIYAEKLKVGVSPALSSAGIYLAHENGFFTSEGLEIELVTIANSGAAMTLLLSKGELDVGAGNLSSGLFNAILSGENFKLVADKGHTSKGHEYIALVVREDLVQSGKFKSLKDLKGMKVGLTALDGVSQQIVVDKILATQGLSGSDITYVKLSYAEMNTAMRSKTLDATIQLEPYLTSGTEDKIFRVIEKSQKYVPDQQSAAVFFSPKMLSEKKALGVKFMIAYLRGVQLYNSALKDKVLWRKISADLKKHINIANRSVWDKMTPIGLRDDGKLNIESIMNDLKWYREKGYVKSSLTADQIVDHSFVKEASELLQKKKVLN